MPNPENIIPYRFKKGRSKEEAAKAGRLGGLARGENLNFRTAIKRRLADGQTLDQIIDAMVKGAKSGDVRAAQFLRDTAGEKPTDNIEVKGQMSVSQVLSEARKRVEEKSDD